MIPEKGLDADNLSFVFTLTLYEDFRNNRAHSALRTPHSALRTPHSALRTPHSALRTPQLSAGERVDLSRYTVATVVPFEMSETARKKDAQFGESFAANIAGRLKSDFGPLFQQVRWNQPLNQPHELIISGVIDAYDPGNVDLRFIVGFGAGAAIFNGRLVLKDGGDQRELMSAPFSKLWAWGGVLGGSKTIEHIVPETAAAAAKTVAAQKLKGAK